MLCDHRYVFFFNDTATTEIYTLSLHDALPIFAGEDQLHRQRRPPVPGVHHGLDERRVAEEHYLVVERRELRERPEDPRREIGRAHGRTPVTPISSMPPSASKKTRRLPPP